MTDREILEIAMRQSAEDIGCRAEDFRAGRAVTVPFKLGENARRYLQEPITFDLVSYGDNVVAASTGETFDLVSEYVGRSEAYRCFETPAIHWLGERLGRRGHKICFMAEYYLPRLDRIPVLPCPYAPRLLEQGDLGGFYRPEWSNALCKERRELDVLGIGAFDGDRLVGLAACSADCGDMWQIGVDVLPGYRRRGIAAALTSALAREILRRGKVPFYCTAWSNIRSAGNAVRSGFLPAWVELTAKPADIVDGMLR